MSIRSVITVALVVGAIGLATYTFSHVSRPIGESAPAAGKGGTAAPARSAQAITPDSGAKPAPIPAVIPAVPPPVEPASAKSGVLTLREPPAGDLASRPRPPQIVLSEVLGPNNSYRDDVFGISATFPEGWTVRGAHRWGDYMHQNTVYLDAGTAITPSMYYKRYQPAEAALRDSSVEAYFRDVAAKKEATRVEAAPDYRNVPESFEFGEINGAPAMSYFATFTQGNKIMTEYFVRVAGPQSYVMFFTSGELEAVRPAMPKIQQMAKSVRIP